MGASMYPPGAATLIRRPVQAARAAQPRLIALAGLRYRHIRSLHTPLPRRRRAAKPLFSTAAAFSHLVGPILANAAASGITTSPYWLWTRGPGRLGDAPPNLIRTRLPGALVQDLADQRLVDRVDAVLRSHLGRRSPIALVHSNAAGPRGRSAAPSSRTSARPRAAQRSARSIATAPHHCGRWPPGTARHRAVRLRCGRLALPRPRAGCRWRGLAPDASLVPPDVDAHTGRRLQALPAKVNGSTHTATAAHAKDEVHASRATPWSLLLVARSSLGEARVAS